jgi:hypothetical protein
LWFACAGTPTASKVMAAAAAALTIAVINIDARLFTMLPFVVRSADRVIHVGLVRDNVASLR